VRAKESRLRKPVMSFLRGLGCENLCLEISFVDREIDVFGLRMAPSFRSYAVELKIENWQKALKQAAIYQLCADYCYVAMPDNKAKSLQLRDFRDAGVGVLGVDLKSKQVVVYSEAQPSSVKRTPYSNYLARAARL